MAPRPGDFPVSERLASQVLSLPCFPELMGDAIARVCTEINQFYEAERKEPICEICPQL